MFYEVFRTRYQGEKLPSPEAIKHGRRVGELRYFERIYDPRPGRSLMIATLTAPDGETYILPVLDRARVRRVDGGILISGLEVIPRGIGIKNIKSDNYPQTWWCRQLPERPTPRQASPAESRVEARRLGEEVGATLNRWPTRRSHYTPPDLADSFDLD